MITFTDCIGLCDLSPAQAIEEHEHVPEMIAASLGNPLVHSSHRPRKSAISLSMMSERLSIEAISPPARHLVDVLDAFLQRHAHTACRTLQ